MNGLNMYVVDFGFTGSASVMARSKEEAFRCFKDQLITYYSDSLTISDIDEYDENVVYTNYGDE